MSNSQTEKTASAWDEMNSKKSDASRDRRPSLEEICSNLHADPVVEKSITDNVPKTSNTHSLIHDTLVADPIAHAASEVKRKSIELKDKAIDLKDKVIAKVDEAKQGEADSSEDRGFLAGLKDKAIGGATYVKDTVSGAATYVKESIVGSDKAAATSDREASDAKPGMVDRVKETASDIKERAGEMLQAVKERVMGSSEPAAPVASESGAAISERK